MTLEAWVRPDQRSARAGGRSIIKERTGDYVVRASTPTRRHRTEVPTGEVFNGGYRDARRHRAARAQHLDAPRGHVRRHDAARSTSTASRPAQLARQRRDHHLDRRRSSIGGNAIWGEWFQGDIDEVRIYNRALTATEIQADMNTSISAPDTTPPSAPGR